jgi:toxin ParE1/3/4
VKPLDIHRQARAELDDSIEWYNERREGLGLELHEEVSAALARIEADPGVGARHGNTRFRFFRVRRFPYVIYYQELPERIWVAAIAHGRRRPNYWRKRKP